MLPLLSEFDVHSHGHAARATRDQVVNSVKAWRVPLSNDALDSVRLCTSELAAHILADGYVHVVGRRTDCGRG
ncbi:hypothetical protein [Kitasatospora sp. NBC_01539]|uniref:hypothetical protein n=1 Tax=Kitasatospora sp. NBC_01539 TaxID=2903577 RepID=UPI0038602AEB